MYVEVQVTGIEQATKVIDDLISRIKDRSSFAETDLAKLLADSFDRAWESQGASQGSKWKDLADNTIKRNGEHRVLDLTGRLRSSLTDVRGSDTDISFSRDTLTYGTTVYYGRFVGGNRPFARLADRDVKEIEKALRDYLVDVKL